MGDKLPNEILVVFFQKYFELTLGSTDPTCHIDKNGRFIWGREGRYSANQLRRDISSIRLVCKRWGYIFNSVKMEYIQQIREIVKYRKRNIISFDDGNSIARSYTQLDILCEIMNRVGWDDTNEMYRDIRPCDYFDVFYGAGSGGILVVLLSYFEMTIGECRSVYLRLAKALGDNSIDGVIREIVNSSTHSSKSNISMHIVLSKKTASVYDVLYQCICESTYEQKFSNPLYGMVDINKDDLVVRIGCGTGLDYILKPVPMDTRKFDRIREMLSSSDCVHRDIARLYKYNYKRFVVSQGMHPCVEIDIYMNMGYVKTMTNSYMHDIDISANIEKVVSKLERRNDREPTIQM
jgi:hypothetical protein